MTTETKPAEKAAPTHEHDEHAIPRDLPKPGPLMIILALLLVAGLLYGLYFLGLTPHKIAVKQAEEDAKELTQGKPIVGVATPKLAAAVREITLPCDVRPFQETSIFSRASGYLKTIKRDINDKVAEGELLAEIDTPEITAQIVQANAALDQAKANVAKSQTDVDLAKRTVTRYEGARTESKGSISDQQLDEVRSTLEQAINAFAVAKANVAVAEANVQQLIVLQGFNKIVAPFAGTITARNFDKGALLSSTTTSGRELFRLSQTDTLKIMVNVPQSYATSVKTGQDVFLTVRNYPGREFKGTVARNTGKIEASTRTLLVETHFGNADATLLAGMYGQIRLPVQSDKPVLMVPTSALIFNAAGLSVAVVKDGKVAYQKITVGRDLGTQIEVNTGVDAADQVIANPGQKIFDGAMVDARPADK